MFLRLLVLFALFVIVWADSPDLEARLFGITNPPSPDRGILLAIISALKAILQQLINLLTGGIGREILRLDKRKPEKFEEFLEKYTDVLHPTNCHVLEVKYALSQMHVNMDGFLLSDDKMVNSFCAVCHQPSQQSCGQCGLVYYCSKEHQVADWKKTHKNNCISYKVEINERIGRHLIATKNIAAGETILKKKPLVLAPKVVSHLLCLGCHRKLETLEYSCSKCSWPLCSVLCEDSKYHIEECKLMSKCGYRPVLKDGAKQTCYALIGPLRALLLKKSTEKFKSMMILQNHLEKQRNSQVYTIFKSTLVPAVINNLKIDTNEEEILKICSIFDTNAFEVRDSKGMVNIRGLYPFVSFISHDCKTNTRHVFIGDDFEISFSTTIPIKKGDLITISYTQTLWGTLARRAHLQSVKQFDCNCERCSDPTELGTYVSSIYCTSCRESNKSNACPKMISTDPLDANAQWECEQCSRIMSAKQYSFGNEALRGEILRLDKRNPEKFEEFLEKYTDVLHKTNCHVLEVKYALSQMHGNMDGFLLSDLSDHQINTKIQLCKELLELADILEPGFSRFRGSLLYDLHAAMVFQAKMEYDQEKITKETAAEILSEAVTVLEESAKILIVEPDMKEILKSRLENMSKYLSLD